MVETGLTIMSDAMEILGGRSDRQYCTAAMSE